MRNKILRYGRVKAVIKLYISKKLSYDFKSAYILPVLHPSALYQTKWQGCHWAETRAVVVMTFCQPVIVMQITASLMVIDR